MNELYLEAAAARRDAATKPADRPRSRRCWDSEDAPRGVLSKVRARPFGAQRAATDSIASLEGVIFGVASVVEEGYEMYDFWGPYTEVVSRNAFDATLGASPLVEFTLNHNRGGGLPMAHTRNGTLTLAATDQGLEYQAQVDKARSDVADMLLALQRGDLAEASFKFAITRGQWSPDYTEFRIEEVDLDRGDVSAVNFGANPLATSGVRMAPALRSLAERLQVGRALDAEDVNMLTQAMAWFSAVDNIVDEAQESLAGYLKVPNPDADDALELSRKRRVHVGEDETRHRH